MQYLIGGMVYDWSKGGLIMAFSTAFRSAFSSIFGEVSAALVLLLRDDFTTAQSAPLTSPRTCEPGPGTWTILDTENKLSIVSDTLAYAGGGASASGDPHLYAAAVTRAVGVGLYCRYRYTATTDNAPLRVGFHSAVPTSGANINAQVFTIVSSTQTITLVGESGGGGIGNGGNEAFAVNTYYHLIMVLRSTGAFGIVKGGVYTDWTLLVPSVFNSSATLYPLIARGLGAQRTPTDIEKAKVFQFIGGSVWLNDYGIATERYAGSISAGQAFTHEGNCLIEWAQTTRPSSGDTFIQFRKQDASNYWRVGIDSGGAMNLVEVVAGAPTTRATAAAVVSSGHRIVIVADGTIIRGYSNNVLRWTYSSASNFSSATSGLVVALGTGGAISDLISWPRVLSGEAADSLDVVVNA